MVGQLSIDQLRLYLLVCVIGEGASPPLLLVGGARLQVNILIEVWSSGSPCVGHHTLTPHTLPLSPLHRVLQ